MLNKTFEFDKIVVVRHC